MAYKTVLDLPLNHFDNVAYIGTLKNLYVAYIVIINIFKFHLKAF